MARSRLQQSLALDALDLQPLAGSAGSVPMHLSALPAAGAERLLKHPKIRPTLLIENDCCAVEDHPLATEHLGCTDHGLESDA
jgi:hypothetical protein